uniref:Uncharacterized protein n=2 Tax=Moniliophthora roreri TaxID=221103 RepID=A0A0W0FML3_MONRR
MAGARLRRAEEPRGPKSALSTEYSAELSTQPHFSLPVIMPMVAVPPGEPKSSSKPQPIGNMPIIILFTTCTMCALFILWRRADALRSVISHQLKVIRQPEGRIRLSEDNGPPAHEFLQDDGDEDAVELEDDIDDEPLTERPPKALKPLDMDRASGPAGHTSV